jgi:hypothetical protein
MLHDLSDSGLISMQGRNIVLLDVEQLRKIGL